MHTVRLLLCLIFIPLLTTSIAWLNNQPQNVGADVPAGKLMSLSFAPFREGFNPLEEVFPLHEHVDEDLKLLADKTETVRTYSSLGGLENVPQLAKQYGINVIQGGWLSPRPKDNYQEMQALIRSANAHPDVVKRVIVGNEVLLRGDLKPEQLINYIREVKQAVKQPVTYADVWSMYMKYPQLMKEVDFITIHILPYWEDEPVSVEEALSHVERIVKQVKDEAHGLGVDKPILIGETGWPGTGRQRGVAVPSVVNEAKFIRGLIQIAKVNGFDYNIVEAFNQPWKSELEGVVGANWGLFSVQRHPVFPLTGKVLENPDWPYQIATAILLWFMVVFYYLKKLHFASVWRLIVFLGIAQLFAVAIVDLTDELWYTSYNNWQRLYTGTIVAANAALAALLIGRNHAILTNREKSPKLAQGLRYGYLFFAALAVYKTFWLSYNGRYLSFPSSQVSVAVIGVLGFMLCQCLNAKFKLSDLNLNALSGGLLSNQWDKRLAYALGFSVPTMIIGETYAFTLGGDFIAAHPEFNDKLITALIYTLVNQQLLLWLISLAILAIPFAFNAKMPYPPKIAQ